MTKKEAEKFQQAFLSLRNQLEDELKKELGEIKLTGKDTVRQAESLAKRITILLAEALIEQNKARLDRALLHVRAQFDNLVAKEQLIIGAKIRRVVFRTIQKATSVAFQVLLDL